MLAGLIAGPRRLEMIELPVPDVGEGQLLVRLEAGSICGSDLPYFLMDDDLHPAVAGAKTPLAPMLSLHELVGRVAKSRSRRFREGDRVLALPATHHMGLAEYFLSRDELAVAVPADGPAERLVLSQPLGTVVHGCLKLPNLLGRTAVVIGQGPIGQLFTAMLRRMGVLRLVAVDLLPERLGVSRVMGATHTVGGGEAETAEVLRDLTAGKGADLVVEAVGRAETLDLATRLIRRHGTVLAFGVPHRRTYDFAFNDFFYREGRLVNSVGPDVQHDFPIAVELIATGAIDVRPLVTHRFPLARAQEAFTVFADRSGGAIKVVLTPDSAGAPGRAAQG